jgi:ATP-binding cassette subfamily B protein IrtB
MTGRRKALQHIAAGGRFDEFWRQQHEAAEWRVLAE